MIIIKRKLFCLIKYAITKNPQDYKNTLHKCYAPQKLDKLLGCIANRGVFFIYFFK